MDADRNASGTPLATASGRSMPSRRSWSGTFALLIALAASVATGFVYWKVIWQADERKSIDDAALQVRMASLADDITTRIDRELGSELQQLEAKGGSVEQRLEAIESAVANLLTESGREVPVSVDDWKIAEAGYLLRMASHRIRLEADPIEALELLRAAEARLAQTAGVQFQPVREAIAGDIVLLEAAGTTADARELYIAIEGLQSALDEVLGTPAAAITETADAGQDYSPEESAGLSWEAITDRFSDLIRIRRVGDEVVRAPPDVVERTLLEQRIRLALQQAQLAVQRREQDVLASSLRSVRKLVTELPASPAMTRFLESLTALESRRIVSARPDLDRSLDAFEAAVASAGPRS